MAKRDADTDLAPTPKKARDGKDTHIDADGTVADGVFADGKLVQCTKTYKDGTVEKGTFDDGKLVKGKKTYKWGVEKGTFVDGQLANGRREMVGDGHSNCVRDGFWVGGDLVRGTRTTDANIDGELGKGAVVEKGHFRRGDDSHWVLPILRRGAQCVIGIDDFENHKIPKPLFKGFWDSDGKFEKGVKFYYELKAQVYKGGIETEDKLDPRKLISSMREDADVIVDDLLCDDPRGPNIEVTNPANNLVDSLDIAEARRGC